ncbi:hypothetical protein CGS58_02960 [Faecalibacterium prausnitzii]|uniref:Uncharacterized protein n=2 Tax=Faecalibacterium prausnitzii TaxID=853 RepID=A0A2A7ATG6_9FIRM|nr:hypothetical protein CGS58_02960 [Faecalibacterium prausnitzii]
MRIQRSLQTMAVWLLPALLMPDAQLMLVALLPLDKDSIDDLKKYLTSIKKNRIIIISTHDKNIVDLADVTINLDKGHIFEAEVL